MMSSRSFADRYQALNRTTVQRQEPSTTERDWPLPDGGRIIEGTAGPVGLFDRLYHGPEIEQARLLIDQSDDLPVDARVYVDTETTGLAGGTGTYAFLIGLGWFEPSGFRVRQYFMRHPGEELALLGYVADHLNHFDGLTTFNGRTFDMPLIETRLRMHRMDYAPPGDHLDLLHPARAIWKYRLESCSLGTLEHHILGVARESDAPGWLIPSIYFSYLRERRVNDLGPVIEHNRFDIVSLARLTGIVGAHLAGLEVASHDADRLAALLLRLRRGQTDLARSVLAESLNSQIPAQLRLTAIRDATKQLKRERNIELATSDLEVALVDPSRDIRLYVAEELAKYHEHGRKDYRTALAISLKARDSALLARDTRLLNAFSHRIRRLEGKVSRA